GSVSVPPGYLVRVYYHLPGQPQDSDHFIGVGKDGKKISYSYPISDPANPGLWEGELTPGKSQLELGKDDGEGNKWFTAENKLVAKNTPRLWLRLTGDQAVEFSVEYEEMDDDSSDEEAVRAPKVGRLISSEVDVPSSELTTMVKINLVGVTGTYPYEALKKVLLSMRQTMTDHTLGYRIKQGAATKVTLDDGRQAFWLGRSEHLGRLSGESGADGDVMLWLKRKLQRAYGEQLFASPHLTGRNPVTGQTEGLSVIGLSKSSSPKDWQSLERDINLLLRELKKEVNAAENTAIAANEPRIQNVLAYWKGSISDAEMSGLEGVLRGTSTSEGFLKRIGKSVRLIDVVIAAVLAQQYGLGSVGQSTIGTYLNAKEEAWLLKGILQQRENLSAQLADDVLNKAIKMRDSFNAAEDTSVTTNPASIRKALKYWEGTVSDDVLVGLEDVLTKRKTIEEFLSDFEMLEDQLTELKNILVSSIIAAKYDLGSVGQSAIDVHLRKFDQREFRLSLIVKDKPNFTKEKAGAILDEAVKKRTDIDAAGKISGINKVNIALLVFFTVFLGWSPLRNWMNQSGRVIPKELQFKSVLGVAPAGERILCRNAFGLIKLLTESDGSLRLALPDPANPGQYKEYPVKESRKGYWIALGHGGDVKTVVLGNVHAITMTLDTIQVGDEVKTFFVRDIQAEESAPHDAFELISLPADKPAVPSTNAAPVVKGGIDLNAQKMTLDVERYGQALEMNVNAAMLAEFNQGNFTGAKGIILNVTPVQSIFPAAVQM
ncbi:MAG: hypothetical protein HQL22_06870, partial [Candidatus Omnitrophica bacterium]|nr:hypothetical protein [Candidatus Omnitrophota bacterium]